jgi:uncharacterized protein
MLYLNDMILELDDGAQVKETTDGYMTAYPRVARTGIQLYRGAELGMKDKAVVRIFRDEAEVFNKDSLASFAGKPFTDNHPPKMVNASNWRKYSAGDAGDEILRDGEFIRVPMMLRDAATIAKVKKGKVQLSVGYGCEIDWTPGTTPKGEAYDGKQIGIRVNHIAVVDAARGGNKLAIGDDGQETNHPLYNADGDAFNEVQPEDKDTMNLKSMIVDGITCEMTDTAVQVVQRALDASNNKFEEMKKAKEEEAKKAKDALDAANAEVAKLTTQLSTKDAEVVTLKKQVEDSVLTADKLDALVKDRQVVADKARVLMPKVVVDGKSIVDVMKQVVEDKLGDKAKGWSDDQIKISFDTLTADVKITAQDGVSRTAAAFSRAPVNAQDAVAKEQRYDNYDKKLSEAWKAPVANA